MEVKTLNQWLFEWGFTWVDGQEQMFKGELTKQEARDTINELTRNGSVKLRGY